MATHHLVRASALSHREIHLLTSCKNLSQAECNRSLLLGLSLLFANPGKCQAVYNRPRSRGAVQIRNFTNVSNVTSPLCATSSDRDFSPSTVFISSRTEVANVQEKFICSVRIGSRAGFRNSRKGARWRGHRRDGWRSGGCRAAGLSITLCVSAPGGGAARVCVRAPVLVSTGAGVLRTLLLWSPILAA